MKIARMLWLVVFLLPGIVAAAQDEAANLGSIKQALEVRYPKMKIIDVQPGPIPSLYEVFTGKSIIYTDKNADHLIDGAIYDSNKKDLTEARLNERNAIRFDSLPFSEAIKIVKGNGSRRLAVFTDPDCPYCQRLEQELKSVSDVTLYLFLFPLKIHPDAERHSKAIWCAQDRAKSWTQWVLDRKEPSEATCSNDPVARTLELGEKLNVSGTPTLYFEDGSRTAGAMSAKDLDARLTLTRKSS